MGKPAATFQQSNYASDGATSYPGNIDADIQVVASIASQFAPHQVPPSPGAPVLSQSVAGALAAATYYVKTTFVTAVGETIPSPESNFAVSINNVLNVAAPSAAGAPAGCTGWNVYVSTATGTETKQNGSTPIALGTAWVEPTSGLVAGTALPAGLSQMKVIVDPGTLLLGGAIVSQAAQLSALVVAPVTNPRIDRVVGDLLTGAISIITGAENVSPVPPAITAGKFPIAQLGNLTVGMTSIGNSLITDERVLIWPKVGKQTLWIPAGAMLPRTSNGCGSIANTETTTNKVNVRSMSYANAVDNFAQFNVKMPKSWDKGAITARFFWFSAAIGNSGTAIWGLQGLALQNASTLDTAYGTIQTVTQTLGAANALQVTGDTPAITIGNSPAGEDWVSFQVKRSGTTDTLNQPALLIGVQLILNANAQDDS